MSRPSFAPSVLGAVEHVVMPVAIVCVLASVAAFGLDRALGTGAFSAAYTQIVVSLLAGVVLTVRYARSYGDQGRAPAWFFALAGAASIAVLAVPLTQGANEGGWTLLVGSALGMMTLWWMAGRLAGRLSLTPRRGPPEVVVVVPPRRGPALADPLAHLGSAVALDPTPGPANLDPLAKFAAAAPVEPPAPEAEPAGPQPEPPPWGAAPPSPATPAWRARLERWARVAASDALGRTEAGDPGRPTRDILLVGLVGGLAFALGDAGAARGTDDDALAAWQQLIAFAASGAMVAILASGLGALKAVRGRGGRADATVLAWRSVVGLGLLLPVLVAGLALPGLRFTGTSAAAPVAQERHVARPSGDPDAAQGSGDSQGEAGEDGPRSLPGGGLGAVLGFARVLAPLVALVLLVLTGLALLRRPPRPEPAVQAPAPPRGPPPLPDDDGTPEATVRIAYARLLRACADRGYAAAGPQTPREFARSLPLELRGAAEPLAELTRAYEAVEYGRGPADAAAARSALQRALNALGPLRAGP